nr:MAG: wsv260-like protein [Penaeus semisulcatus pemonivirus]
MSVSKNQNQVSFDDNPDYRAEVVPRANNVNNPGSPRRHRGRRHQSYRNHSGRSTQYDRHPNDRQISETTLPTLEELERIASSVVYNRLIPDSQKLHTSNIGVDEIPSGNIINVCSDCIDFMAKLIPDPELIVAAPASDGTTNKNSEDVRQAIMLTDQHRHRLVENFLKSLELQASDVCHLDSFINDPCTETVNNIISALPANVVVDIAQMCKRPDLIKKSFGDDVYASLMSKGMIIDYGNSSTGTDWWSPLLKYTNETHGDMMTRNVPDGCENCQCFQRDVDVKYQLRTSKNISDFISGKCKLESCQEFLEPDAHSETLGVSDTAKVNSKESSSSTIPNVDWSEYETSNVSQDSEEDSLSVSDGGEGNTSSRIKDKESEEEVVSECDAENVEETLQQGDTMSTASTIPFTKQDDDREEVGKSNESKDDDRKGKREYINLFDTEHKRWKSLSKHGQPVTCLGICKHVNGCPIRKINAERFRSAVDVKANDVIRQKNDHHIPEDAKDVELSWRLEMRPNHILAFSSNADMLSATLIPRLPNVNMKDSYPINMSVDDISKLLVEEELPANLSLAIVDGFNRPSVTSRLCIHTVISASMQVPRSDGAIQTENGMRYIKTWRNVLPATYTGIPVTDDTTKWRSVMYTQTTKDEALRIARFSPVEIVPCLLSDTDPNPSRMIYNHHKGQAIDMEMVGLSVQRYGGGEPGIYWLDDKNISRLDRKKIRMELDMALEERKTHVADMGKRAKYVTETMFGGAVNRHNEIIRIRDRIIRGGDAKDPTEINEADNEVVSSDKVITNLAIHTHILNQQSRQLKADVFRLTNNARSSSVIF